jgi:2-alkyl-3-oxoalkanoate reductase
MNLAAQRPLVAITGASGFVGRRLAPVLAAAGWQVRMLLRRDPVVSEWRDFSPQIVAGDLRDAVALEQLVDGAAAVIHVAGLIKAARRHEFYAVNHDCAAMLAKVTARVAPAAHFVHLSTIGAREPKLSDYTGSKRAGEDAVREILGSRVTVVRPPAVYGPGDRESLVFFQMASKRFIPLAGLPQARAAMIHVDDLARVLAAIAGDAPRNAVLTASDANLAGYSWEEVFRAAANAVGNTEPKFFHAPAVMLRAIAWAGDLARLAGVASMLSSQKLRELRHVDWSVKPEEWARPPGWAPRYTLQDGFNEAAAWYRKAGWLPLS